MRKRIKKIIATAVTLCLTVGSFVLPVSAADYNVSVFGVYDDGIRMNEDDVFILDIINDKNKTQQLKVEMNLATEEGHDFTFEPGYYTITDIRYEGSSDIIEKNGYAATSSFTVTESEDSYAEIFIAVGAESGSDLQMQYMDTIQKLDGQFVDYLDLENGITNPETGEKVPGTGDIAENQETGSEEQENATEQEDETETEETDTTEEKQDKKENTKPKTNYVAKIAPMIVISIIFGIVAYLLHKRNII